MPVVGKMAAMEHDDEDQLVSYEVFRDCISVALVEHNRTASKPPKQRRRAKHRLSTTTELGSEQPATGQAQEDLAEFIDYIASEIFECLPLDLQQVDFRSYRESAAMQREYALPLTPENITKLDLIPSITENLITYGVIAPDPSLSSDLPATIQVFLAPVLSSYLASRTTPPPATYATRASECEICDRSWIPLSYHHLIPRSVHDKVVKRGWHSSADLNNVAWLCGACHRFVHQFKPNEELASDYYTVELLLEEEEVQKWAEWASKLRWKGGRGVRRKPL